MSLGTSFLAFKWLSDYSNSKVTGSAFSFLSLGLTEFRIALSPGVFCQIAGTYHHVLTMVRWSHSYGSQNYSPTTKLVLSKNSNLSNQSSAKNGRTSTGEGNRYNFSNFNIRILFSNKILRKASVHTTRKSQLF